MGNVMVIPAKRQVGNNIKKAEKPKLRVAAYCRVWSYVKKKYKLNMPFLRLAYPAKASAFSSNAA